MAFKLAFYFEDDLLLKVRGTTRVKFEKLTKALTIHDNRFIHEFWGDENVLSFAEN